MMYHGIHMCVVYICVSLYNNNTSLFFIFSDNNEQQSRQTTDHTDEQIKTDQDDSDACDSPIKTKEEGLHDHDFSKTSTSSPIFDEEHNCSNNNSSDDMTDDRSKSTRFKSNEKYFEQPKKRQRRDHSREGESKYRRGRSTTSGMTLFFFQ